MRGSSCQFFCRLAVEESDANESRKSDQLVQYDADVLDEDDESNEIDESDEIYKNIDSHNILCHEIALEQHSTNEIAWQKHRGLLDIYEDEPHNRQLIYLIAVTNNKNDQIKSMDVQYVGISKAKVRALIRGIFDHVGTIVAVINNNGKYQQKYNKSREMYDYLSDKIKQGKFVRILFTIVQ